MNKEQITSSIKLCLDEDGVSSVLWNGTEAYYTKIESAYTDIEKNNYTDSLYFAFFILVISTLEYSLNYILIKRHFDLLGEKKYKQKAKKDIKMNFKEKLLITPKIVSNGEFVINKQSSSFKILTQMVTFRNQILHNKDFHEEIKNKKCNYKNEDGNISFQIEHQQNIIDTITKNNCKKYWQAINDFKNLIMIPCNNHNLTTNDMILQNNYE